VDLQQGCGGRPVLHLTGAHLLDSLPACLSALAAGVDAACVLLRVGGVVAE